MNMQPDLKQNEAQIVAPNDSSKVKQYAIPPNGIPVNNNPVFTNGQTGTKPPGNDTRRKQSNLYGMPLAWRGIYLLTIAFTIAVVWFFVAWLTHGRIPITTLHLPEVQLSGISRHGVSPLQPIYPPFWLLVMLGTLTIISFMMMLLGTQNVNSKKNYSKDQRAEHAPPAGRGEAPRP